MVKRRGDGVGSQNNHPFYPGAGQIIDLRRTVDRLVETTWGTPIASPSAVFRLVGMICFVLVFCRLSSAQSVESIAVPEGFECDQIAGDNLVHDAFSMTLDGKGRPIVSGPGYIRTLIDDNGDSIFDRYITWSNLPIQGAQGLWSEGNQVYWVGDGGLWVSQDQNGDLVADGSPQKKLDLPTGGEHDSHAIRRGPDGWWYLIVGNFANGISNLQNDPEAPIINPRAGTIWRISPDFSKRGCWAHGFRNAYDFDFLSNGSIVTFDSDEEREVTLPWYRPTRVMVVSPGCDGGWLDSAWFDLDQRVTMPQTIARLGRGSPTGVAVYRHDAFPSKYSDAAFVLDWTFGRVVAVYPQPSDERDATEGREVKPSRFMAETFMQTTGTEGFAPTDICIDLKGSVLVCVGGRGTAGAIFRVKHKALPESNSEMNSLIDESQIVKIAPENDESVNNKGLHSVSPEQLSLIRSIGAAVSPLDSWSRSQSLDAFKKLPEGMLEDFCAGRLRLRLQKENSVEGADKETDSEKKEKLSAIEAQWRRTAAQFLLYKDQTVSFALIESMVRDASSTSQAAGWWLLGHSPIGLTSSQQEEIEKAIAKNQELPNEQMDDRRIDDWSASDRLLGEMVSRAQFEAIGLKRIPVSEPMMDVPAESADWQPKNALRHIQLWAYHRIKERSKAKLESYNAIIARLIYGKVLSTVDGAAMDSLAKRISTKQVPSDPQSILEAMTVLQAAMGEWRHTIPLQKAPAQIHATDGYRSWFGVSIPENVREGWTKWLLTIVESHRASPNSDQPPPTPQSPIIVAEAVRTLAMLETRSPDAIDSCLSLITEQSHPTWDVHALVSISCFHGKRSEQQTVKIARSLPMVLKKVNALSLNTDSRWTTRLEQLFSQLVLRDPKLPNALVNNFELNKTNSGVEELVWVEWCSPEVQKVAREKILVSLLSTSPPTWNEELVRFVCKNSVEPRLAQSLRKAMSEEPKNGTVSNLSEMALELLTKNSIASDYPWLIREFRDDASSEVLSVAWSGLNRLPIQQPKVELPILAKLMVKIQSTAVGTISIPTVTNRLRNAGRSLKLSGIPTSDSMTQWLPFFKQHLTATDFAYLNQISTTAPKDWTTVLSATSAIAGDKIHGAEVYKAAKCNQCHGGNNALGPSLSGVAQRFSKNDLFRAIYEPSKDISDRYRAVKILTSNGDVVSGLKIYDSADGVTLQASNGKLLRINEDDIESKETSNISLMPANLLDGFSVKDVADLYAYLRSL